MKKSIFVAVNLLISFGFATFAYGQTSVGCFSVSGTNIFAGTGDGVFLSSDTGKSWVPINSGLPSGSFNTFTLMGTNLFVGSSDSGVFHSTNNGKTWDAVNGGLQNSDICALAGNDNVIWAGTINDGTFRSTNYGATWTPVNNGLGYGNNSIVWFQTLLAFGMNILGGSDYGVYLSEDKGARWFKASGGLGPESVHTFMVMGNDIYAATAKGVFLSMGNSWTNVSNGIPEPSDVHALTYVGTNLFAAVTDRSWSIYASPHQFIFRSTNNGSIWSVCGVEFPENAFVYALANVGTKLFAGTHDGIYQSTDSGVSWTPCTKLWNDRIEARIKAKNAEVASKKKAEEAEAKREAVARKKLKPLLTRAVIQRLATHFLDFSDATKAAFALNMSLGTNFDGMKLWADANSGGIKSYFEQQFQTVHSFSDMQLEFLSSTLGLTYNESRALQIK